MQMPNDPYQNQTSKSKVWLAVGALVLVAMIGFGLGAGVLGLRGKDNASTLNLTAKPQAPVLAEDGKPSGPVLPADNIMPRDVLDWLKHLEETERRRRDLSNQELGKLLPMMVNLQTGGGVSPMKSLFGDEGPDVEHLPTADIEKATEEVRDDWRRLDDFFQSVPPPAECAPIQAAYSQAIGETSAMMMDILGVVKSAAEDPQDALAKLNAMRGKSSDRIDKSARRTDELVQDICDKYKTRKWFRIDTDFGGGLGGAISGMGF